MNHLNALSILCLLLSASLFATTAYAATFNVKNNCPFTVWAAAVPGGGRQMNQGDTWTVTANPGQTSARIWARTGCTSGGGNSLRCNTGDCGGVLQCTGFGQPPNTLAEYSLRQFNNLDFFDISLVDGFNVPMTFLPTSGCSSGPTCRADVNANCPSQLRANGGCNNPCTVFKTDQYCCTSGGSCGPTPLSQYFKNLCPTAYSYPKDDATSTFTCPSGTNYAVTFCP